MQRISPNPSPLVRVQLTAEDRERLLAIVNARETTVSAYVRKLIVAHLDAVTHDDLP